jgi:hypothetical protein
VLKRFIRMRWGGTGGDEMRWYKTTQRRSKCSNQNLAHVLDPRIPGMKSICTVHIAQSGQYGRPASCGSSFDLRFSLLQTRRIFGLQLPRAPLPPMSCAANSQSQSNAAGTHRLPPEDKNNKSQIYGISKCRVTPLLGWAAPLCQRHAIICI